MYKGSENIYHPTKLYKHIHRCVYMISKSMARRLSEAFLVFMPSGLLSMSDSIFLPLVYSSHSPVSLIGDLSASSCYSPSFHLAATSEPIDSFSLTSSQFICLSVHGIIYRFTFLFLPRGIPIYFHYIHDITKTGFLCHLLKHLERIKSNIHGCRKGLNIFF